MIASLSRMDFEFRGSPALRGDAAVADWDISLHRDTQSLCHRLKLMKHIRVADSGSGRRSHRGTNVGSKSQCSEAGAVNKGYLL